MSVKLAPNVWTAFKDNLSEVPPEVLDRLLTDLKTKIASCDIRSPVSVLWTWPMGDCQWTAPLLVEVHFQGSDRVILRISGWIYKVPLPQSGV